jgi:hypothetical protein
MSLVVSECFDVKVEARHEVRSPAIGNRPSMTGLCFPTDPNLHRVAGDRGLRGALSVPSVPSQLPPTSALQVSCRDFRGRSNVHHTHPTRARDASRSARLSQPRGTLNFPFRHGMACLAGFLCRSAPAIRVLGNTGALSVTSLCDWAHVQSSTPKRLPHNNPRNPQSATRLMAVR